MKNKPAIMIARNMSNATERAHSMVASWIQRAQNVIEDTAGELRKEAQLCPACFYSVRVGGQAMTEQPCMCCNESQLYGSTATDVLCRPCAIEAELCKRCGGDIEMRVERVSWPLPRLPNIGDVKK